MKFILFLLFVMSSFISCVNKTPQKKSSTDVEVVADENKRSADKKVYVGSYEGMIPCADCPGIKVELSLDNKDNYTKKMTYIDREPDNTFITSGRFTWNDKEKIIRLGGNDDGEIYKAKGESLLMLDRQGNEITGSNADRYILNRVK